MSEQLKYLVNELNKEPFNKNYNLIVFDSMSGEQLLQILSDVLAEIDAKNMVDIREEEPDVTVLRILGMLRILKYKPPNEIAQEFREGILEGHKLIIYPVLEWLLQKIPELRKRAYLAKYLVKIDIPPELMVDPDVGDLYGQYSNLIENFKAVHKECEAIKNSGYSTSELRKDIEEMENEKEIVQKKIERMERKVEGTPNAEVMLEVAKKLRQEKEKEKELITQKQEQRVAIQHGDQRIQRMGKQLQDLRQSGAGATSEGLIVKLEEEVNVNRYIVTQKLPKELESKRKVVKSLQAVTNQPALGQDDINGLKSKIKDINTEINELSEKKNVTNDPMEDKLTLFRQQAAIIGRKKESTAERLSDTRNEVGMIDEEVNDKREKVKSFSGETILRGDDFKKYVSTLRSKSNVYKQRKADLSDVKAEYGVLMRTVEILQAKEKALQQTLATLEQEKGVSGFRDTQNNLEKVASMKANIDEEKGKTLEEMSSLVQQLSMKINERKARLAPIIKELRPLRLQAQDMQVDYDEKKQQYDTLLLQLESSMGRLEQEVRKAQEEILSNERKFHLLQEQNCMNEMWLKRAQDELKSYVSNPAGKWPFKEDDEGQERKKSVRDQLLKLIAEQEKKGKLLKDEQKKMKENLTLSSKQVELWTNLERLFICKKKSVERQLERDDTVIHREPGTETLVL